jgi:hypothetical protein
MRKLSSEREGNLSELIVYMAQLNLGIPLPSKLEIITIMLYCHLKLE